jgi:four helix bundle protein
MSIMTNNYAGKRTYDLERRLIDFAVRIIALAESLPNSRTGSHMANQLVRSGTSPALNYGEAQSAESRNDFIHKMKIVLKELRETSISLRIIKHTGMIESAPSLSSVLDECCELVAIFAKSLQTAEARRKMQ